MTMTLTQTAQKALERLLALRRLTFETNSITRRSQNRILQSLSDEDLIVVAEQLEAHRATHGW